LWDKGRRKKKEARNQFISIGTYDLRSIHEGVAEASQISLQNTQILPKLAKRKTADERGGKPIVITNV
jgi:hypothetical protein